MSFQDEIKKIVGNDVFSKLEHVANDEVSQAMKMPLEDEDGQRNHHEMSFFVPSIISECELFEQKGLKISPIDIVKILFRCKLLFAVKNEDEYMQKVGDIFYVEEKNLIVHWNRKAEKPDSLIDEYIDKLEKSQQKRTLISQISCFYPDYANQQIFFDNLFKKLGFPFSCYLDEERIINQCKIIDLDPKDWSTEHIRKNDLIPSFGFTTYGSYNYSYWYASAWLRTFLNLLKIAGFVCITQIFFVDDNVKVEDPIYPFFLGNGSTGCFFWDEDTKESWAKVPDGFLFQLYRSRQIWNMYLDNRNFNEIEEFFIENRKIFEIIKNPWDSRYIKDISIMLDILSSATQNPDLGAKVLLIYCCLEHLFVPENIRSDNKKYIVGGINALRSDLLKWFNELYKLRCDYAHKGFIEKDYETRALIMKSILNVMVLLRAKLCNS